MGLSVRASVPAPWAPARAVPDRRGNEARILRQHHLIVDDVDRNVENRRFTAPQHPGPADGDVETLLALDHAGLGLIAPERC